MRYFLGLDNGGTTTKAALYTAKGEEIGVASVDTAMLTPQPGFTELNMDEMWQANCTVIRQVIAKTGIQPQDIAGLAICGHGKGLYLWGKDGRPVRPGIISTDNRAWEYPKNWEADGTAEKVFAISCQHILACQPVSLLAWLRDHEPQSLPKIEWIFSCKDYVRYRLTGEAWGERTDCSGSNWVNLHTGQYDPELFRLFGLESLAACLPPLCYTTDLCGLITREAAALTGLQEGTPVAAGMFDIDACALAVNVVDEEHICMIAGTWSINEYVRKTPVLDGSVLMNSFFCIPGTYLIEECSPTSAGNNEWFVKTLLPELSALAKEQGKNIYQIADAWVDELPASEFCPIFLPFLMASNVHPNAKGSFVGMSNYHTRKHLMRSVLEGITFSHRYHYERLMHTRSAPPRSIRLAGGAARSKVWTQMFADVMNCPVEVVNVRETGALGCAIAAAVAANEYQDLREAASSMCHIASPVLPNPQNTRFYDEKYRLYNRVITALDSVWDDIQAIMGVRHQIGTSGE